MVTHATSDYTDLRNRYASMSHDELVDELIRWQSDSRKNFELLQEIQGLLSRKNMSDKDRVGTIGLLINYRRQAPREDDNGYRPYKRYEVTRIIGTSDGKAKNPRDAREQMVSDVLSKLVTHGAFWTRSRRKGDGPEKDYFYKPNPEFVKNLNTFPLETPEEEAERPARGGKQIKKACPDCGSTDIAYVCRGCGVSHNEEDLVEVEIEEEDSLAIARKERIKKQAADKAAKKAELAQEQAIQSPPASSDHPGLPVARTLYAEIEQHFKTSKTDKKMWKAPGSGFDVGLIDHDVYKARIRECCKSGDAKRIDAAIIMMKSTLGKNE